MNRSAMYSDVDAGGAPIDRDLKVPAPDIPLPSWAQMAPWLGAGIGLLLPIILGKTRRVKMTKLERTLSDLVRQLLELIGKLEDENDKLSDRPTKEYVASTEKKLKSLELDYTALQGELKAAREEIASRRTGMQTLQEEIMVLRKGRQGPGKKR